MGRVLQEDTYRGDGLNLYAYCANTPVMYDDPSGHKTNYNDEVPEPVKTPGNQVVNSDGVEIPWSSKVVSDASDQLDSGVRTVTLSNRSQAEELFLGKYQGDGYTNVTGMDSMDTKDYFFFWGGGVRGTHIIGMIRLVQMDI